MSTENKFSADKLTDGPFVETLPGSLPQDVVTNRDVAPIDAKFARLDQALKDLEILTDKTIQRLTPVLCAAFEYEGSNDGDQRKPEMVNPASKISRVLDDLIETVETITAKVEDAKLRLEI